MLVDLSLLVVHLLLVLLTFEQNLILVVLLNLLDGGEEILVLTLFLCLKSRELLCVLEHLLRVLIALLLNLVLLLVQKLSALDLHGALRLIDLSQKRLLLVLCLLALRNELVLLLSNG